MLNQVSCVLVTRTAHQKIMVEGRDVVPDVWEVLDKIKTFSDKVRNGEWLGVTGKPLKKVVAVGIGGSFLGPLFVHTALRCALVDPVPLLTISMPLHPSPPSRSCLLGLGE